MLEYSSCISASIFFKISFFLFLTIILYTGVLWFLGHIVMIVLLSFGFYTHFQGDWKLQLLYVVFWSLRSMPWDTTIKLYVRKHRKAEIFKKNALKIVLENFGKIVLPQLKLFSKVPEYFSMDFTNIFIVIEIFYSIYIFGSVQHHKWSHDIIIKTSNVQKHCMHRSEDMSYMKFDLDTFIRGSYHLFTWNFFGWLRPEGLAST